MQKTAIPDELLQGILNYLVSRPYVEVYSLVARLQTAHTEANSPPVEVPVPDAP